MKIEVIIENTLHPSINRLARKQGAKLQQTLLEHYVSQSPTHDFREIMDVFKDRPREFMISTSTQRFIFEESGLTVQWGEHNQRILPCIHITYQGRPKTFRSLSFFSDLGDGSLIGRHF